MTYVFKIQAGVLMYFLFIIYLTLNLKLVRIDTDFHNQFATPTNASFCKQTFRFHFPVLSNYFSLWIS